MDDEDLRVHRAGIDGVNTATARRGGELVGVVAVASRECRSNRCNDFEDRHCGLPETCVLLGDSAGVCDESNQLLLNTEVGSTLR